MPTSPYELMAADALAPVTTAAISYNAVFQQSGTSSLASGTGQPRRLGVLPQLALTALALTASSISVPQDPVGEATRWWPPELAYRASRSETGRVINLRQARQVALAAHHEIEARLKQDRASEAKWTNVMDGGESDEA